MTRDQVNALVHGYLARSRLHWERRADGQQYRVDHGTTAIFIRLYPYHEHVVVHMTAPVLHDVSPEAPLAVLAELNANLPFAKFCFHPEGRKLTLEYELLGASMDEDEFFNALSAVGSVADDYDEALRDNFGFAGHVFSEVPKPPAS